MLLVLCACSGGDAAGGSANGADGGDGRQSREEDPTAPDGRAATDAAGEPDSIRNRSGESAMADAGDPDGERVVPGLNADASALDPMDPSDAGVALSTPCNGARCLDADGVVAGFDPKAPPADRTVTLNDYEWWIQPITIETSMVATYLWVSLDTVATDGQALESLIYSERIDPDTGQRQPDREVGRAQRVAATPGYNAGDVSAYPVLEAGETYWLAIRVLDGDLDSAGTPVAEVEAFDAPDAPYLRHLSPDTWVSLEDPMPSARPDSGARVVAFIEGDPLP
ncbi:MAG: hypothetical protein PVI30_08525 [Myxococcales bacterium]